MISPDCILQLQGVLGAAGIYVDAQDGILGPRTLQAVEILKGGNESLTDDIEAFQHALNLAGVQPQLVEDGVWGAKTDAAWQQVVSYANAVARGVVLPAESTVGAGQPILIPSNSRELESPPTGTVLSGTLLTTIHDETDIQVWLFTGEPDAPNGSIHFKGYGRIDTDGIGPHHGDHTAQNDTSLHVNGHALNADVDRFIVLPEQIFAMVGPKVLGCLVYVTLQGVATPTREAVCGDAGPRDRAGEMSRCLALDFGVSGDPNSGGINTPTVSYRFILGVPAPGYALQSA